jgi:hypothetical protein
MCKSRTSFNNYAVYGIAQRLRPCNLHSPLRINAIVDDHVADLPLNWGEGETKFVLFNNFVILAGMVSRVLSKIVAF